MNDAPSRSGSPPSRAHPRGSEPLEALLDAPRPDGLEIRGGLTEELARTYAGDLAIPLRPDRPTIIANFVETIDGAIALDREGRTGGREVSGFSPTDRFVMGLLRALADVVVVGAGTVRASEGSGWTPRRVHPLSAAAYAGLREHLGLAPQPTTMIVTGSGGIDAAHPAFREADVPIVLVAPARGAHRLQTKGFPANVAIETAGDGDQVEPTALVAVAARLGARLVLTEGGPHLFGALAAAGLLDELFLTLSPQLVGRDADAGRLALVEAASLWPAAPWADLVSVRKAASHLFLRYRFTEDPS